MQANCLNLKLFKKSSTTTVHHCLLCAVCELGTQHLSPFSTAALSPHHTTPHKNIYISLALFGLAQTYSRLDTFKYHNQYYFHTTLPRSLQWKTCHKWAVWCGVVWCWASGKGVLVHTAARQTPQRLSNCGSRPQRGPKMILGGPKLNVQHCFLTQL